MVEGSGEVELVQQLFTAYATGDRASLAEGLAPDVVWEARDVDGARRQFVGVEEVLAHLFDSPHVDEQQFEVVDWLAGSSGRTALVARTTNRRGDVWFVHDFVLVLRVEGGRVVESLEYARDAEGLVAFMSVPSGGGA
jgi:ketosteroid isomerase-like protein